MIKMPLRRFSKCFFFLIFKLKWFLSHNCLVSPPHAQHCSIEYLIKDSLCICNGHFHSQHIYECISFCLSSNHSCLVVHLFLRLFFLHCLLVSFFFVCGADTIVFPETEKMNQIFTWIGLATKKFVEMKSKKKGIRQEV